MNNTNDGVLIPVSTPKTKKKVNMSPKAVERRKRVIKRLEEQLKLGGWEKSIEGFGFWSQII